MFNTRATPPFGEEGSRDADDRRAGTSRFCDGVSRRDFLKIGGLALGGLSLPQLLRAEAAAGIGRSHKAVIMIFLAGGPPHQDMFDLKPDAPTGIRGEFKPIATNVPGLDICEHMPRLARMMDKFAVIRSLVGAGGDHSAGQCLTGYPRTRSARPRAAGRAWARSSRSCRGRSTRDVPPFVGLSPRTGEPRWGNPGDPGFLGLAHAPFTPFRTEQAGTRRSRQRLAGPEPRRAGHRPERLAGRRSLLGQLDGFRRDARPRRGHARAWTPSPSGPSTSSPRGGSSRPSTSPRKTRGSATATASAT